MSDKKKHYRRSAYLDDFQMDADGKYIYTGKRYGFDGEPRKRRIYLASVVLFGLLSLLATVVPECLPPTEISRTPLTLIPWGLQLIASLVVSWAICRIFAHAAELRAYVYSRTVASLPAKSVVLAFLSVVTLIFEIVCYFVKGLSPDGFTLARMICPALSAAAALLLFFVLRRGKWIELP